MSTRGRAAELRADSDAHHVIDFDHSRRTMLIDHTRQIMYSLYRASDGQISNKISR